MLCSLFNLASIFYNYSAVISTSDHFIARWLDIFLSSGTYLDYYVAADNHGLWHMYILYTRKGGHLFIIPFSSHSL
jgi:hypothetical protein